MNELIDNVSAFIAKRPGLLPLIGILLILINLILQIFPGDSFAFVRMDIFLHLGLIVALIGILFIKPLQ